jgi:hypothetical protein
MCFAERFDLATGQAEGAGQHDVVHELRCLKQAVWVAEKGGDTDPDRGEGWSGAAEHVWARYGETVGFFRFELEHPAAVRAAYHFGAHHGHGVQRDQGQEVHAKLAQAGMQVDSVDRVEMVRFLPVGA